MRTLNFYGTTSCFIPKLDATLPLASVGGTIAGNKIIFFTGTVPSIDTLYEIQSESALRTAYASNIIADISGMDFTYVQDNTNLKRTIYKKPDVLDLPYLQTGDITWCAIILAESVATTGYNCILYTDSIGTREQDLKFVTLESLSGTVGDPNLLRDFSMIMTEKSTMEV